MTVQIALRISDDLARELDATVQSDRFENRSDALRVAVEEFVRRRRSAAIDRAIIDGYRRVPVAVVDDWGSIESAHAIASSILAHSLDTEDGGW